MKKTAKESPPIQEVNEEQEPDGLAAVVHHGLFARVLVAGLRTVADQLEGERTTLCGPRYQHCPDRKATRAGHVKSSLALGGRRIEVKRPRVVGADGQEIPLPLWQELASSDALNERAFEQMVLGVATRKFGRSLERLPDNVVEVATSRSAVSRHFVEATAARLEKMVTRELGCWDIVVVYIDGLHFRGHVVLVALGVDIEGYKHVLGMREGATENEVACTALLSDLVVRGLRSDVMRLFVVDGAKALRRSISNVFGDYALVQRCQFHKVRNVINHLPKHMHPSIRSAMRQAYKSPNPETAQRILLNLARRLQEERPSAASSVREGLDETLTTMGLDLPRVLERSLSTTNPLESVNDQLRFIARRVKRWRGGQMILRWVAAGALEAERGFRRIKGAKHMQKLVKLLRAKEAALRDSTKAA